VRKYSELGASVIFCQKLLAVKPFVLINKRYLKKKKTPTVLPRADFFEKPFC